MELRRARIYRTVVGANGKGCLRQIDSNRRNDRGVVGDNRSCTVTTGSAVTAVPATAIVGCVTANRDMLGVILSGIGVYRSLMDPMGSVHRGLLVTIGRPGKVDARRGIGERSEQERDQHDRIRTDIESRVQVRECRYRVAQTQSHPVQNQSNNRLQSIGRLHPSV